MSSVDRRELLGLASCSLAVDATRFVPEVPATPTPPTPPELRGGAGTPEEPHMRVIDVTVDVLVAGGGMSGVCAALAAARNGARVLLVQDRSRLGGNASSEIKMHIVGADSHGARAGWREGGLIEELRVEDAVGNPHRAFELFDLMLYDKCQREELLELRLDTTVYRVEKDAEAIARVWARCDKTETLYRIAAGTYVDATGDARLGLEADAAFRMGREARSEFGEDLAVETADSLSQGCTILFTAKQHDREMPFVAPPWAREITEDDLLFRGIPTSSWEYGYWWIELGGNRDSIHDGEELRFELLRVVLGVWNWIKNSGDRPKSANWALQTVGMIPGKRESRRLEGAHVQTQHDLTGGWKQRDDGVSIGGWGFDDHPPGGFDAWDEPPFRSKPIDEPYNIAFEALYSSNVPNLMMAGRNISNSHVAFTSSRVMATCASIGQAVGTAAAMCAEHDLTPRALRRTRMVELQQRLLRDDQTIRGVVNEDPADHARRARVTSNISAPGAPAQVIDGHVRDVPGEWKHRWGALLEGREAALTLEWDEEIELSEVQLTFDTGFHRELTLSAQDGRSAKMHRCPQPETVREYVLAAVVDGEEQVLAAVDGNYQRLVRHHFDPIRTRRLTLKVQATNGSKEARVFEVRCYS